MVIEKWLKINNVNMISVLYSFLAHLWPYHRPDFGNHSSRRCVSCIHCWAKCRLAAGHVCPAAIVQETAQLLFMCSVNLFSHQKLISFQSWNCFVSLLKHPGNTTFGHFNCDLSHSLLFALTPQLVTWLPLPGPGLARAFFLLKGSP